jgi:hypothetical protein
VGWEVNNKRAAPVTLPACMMARKTSICRMEIPTSGLRQLIKTYIKTESTSKE